MSVKNVLTVVAILLIAVLAVGLVICRPMAADNYASGQFNLEAVSEIRARAWESPAEADWLALTDEDAGFSELIDLVDGKGFGRDPSSLFREPDAAPSDGDRCWQISFRCALSGGQLDMSFSGGVLRLTGDTSVTVTAQDKSDWAGEVYDLIVSLYPAPEEAPGDAE